MCQLRVCAWHDGVFGCNVGQTTYDCDACDCLAECKVAEQWQTFTLKQKESCNATHGICLACLAARRMETSRGVLNEKISPDNLLP